MSKFSIIQDGGLVAAGALLCICLAGTLAGPASARTPSDTSTDAVESAVRHIRDQTQKRLLHRKRLHQTHVHRDRRQTRFETR
jgi:hypothetical protein